MNRVNRNDRTATNDDKLMKIRYFRMVFGKIFENRWPADGEYRGESIHDGIAYSRLDLKFAKLQRSTCTRRPDRSSLCNENRRESRTEIRCGNNRRVTTAVARSLYDEYNIPLSLGYIIYVHTYSHTQTHTHTSGGRV